MNSKTTAKKRLILLAVLTALIAIYLVPLGGYPLLEPDEGRYAEIPREMLESGNFITPMLNYVQYFEKPAMLYWMNAASFAAFGQNEFAARFASALCALLGAGVTGLLASFIFGSGAGILASVMTALSLLYFAIGTINITDMPMSFFLTLTMASFYVGHIKGEKKWYLLFYASMALGLLTKGLIAIVLPGGIIFWYIIFTRKWKLFIEALYIPGIILFFAISVPWFYMVCKANPDFFHFFFIQEHFLRYATKMHHRYEPFWFFLPMIPAGLMPWTPLFLSLFSKESVVRSPEDSAQKDAVIYLLLWFGVILLFFSLSDSKLIPYITPCMPPLAILMTGDICRMVKREKWHGGVLWWMLGISSVFSVALIAYPFIGDEISAYDALPIASKAVLGLMLAPIYALIFTTHGRRRFREIVIVFCISALFFIAGIQGIYKILGERRSMKDVSAAINAEWQQGETVAAYGEILQGIPFYTKKRVMLVGTTGELEFGSKHKEGEGWFPNNEEFLKEWKSGSRKFVLAIEKDRVQDLFPDGNTYETKRCDVGDYLVLFNREASK